MQALIEERSRMIRNAFISLFSKNKASSIALESAAEALAALEAERVDFLCFSMQIKEMTGIDFLVRPRSAG